MQSNLSRRFLDEWSRHASNRQRWCLQTGSCATVAHWSNMLTCYKRTNIAGFIVRDGHDEQNSPEEEKVVEVLGDGHATGRRNLSSLTPPLAHTGGLLAALKAKTGSWNPGEASCAGGQAPIVAVGRGNGEGEWADVAAQCEVPEGAGGGYK
jgi:hypothetical protein